ncbi:MAG: tRNA glutamyl-Q(34) synthetase GluQRS [Phyllobacterium sp.]
MSSPAFRFAPSPNGRLHLGHVWSALQNVGMARKTGGRFLLRIEDIDTARCTPELERLMLEDLRWLGFQWEEPVRRQSEHFGDYGNALSTLREMDLIYPSFLTRADIRNHVREASKAGIGWPIDPDGAPLSPVEERDMPASERARRIAAGKPFAWRLNMDRAVSLAGEGLGWNETGLGPDAEKGLARAQPERWGDVILARKEMPTSYHLSVVIDDALQQITNVVRGRDLFHATSVQRLLQKLLSLPEPVYHHHSLVLGEDGRKLSKSRGDTAIAALRDQGQSPQDVLRLAGRQAADLKQSQPSLEEGEECERQK